MFKELLLATTSNYVQMKIEDIALAHCNNLLCRLKVERDGACFYHSLSILLDLEWKKIKDEILTHMHTDRDEYCEPFSILHPEVRQETMIAFYRPHSTFADELIVRAAAAALGVTIYVISLGEGVNTHFLMKFTGRSGVDERSCILYLSREHYEPVKLIVS